MEKEDPGNDDHILRYPADRSNTSWGKSVLHVQAADQWDQGKLGGLANGADGGITIGSGSAMEELGAEADYNR